METAQTNIKIQTAAQAVLLCLGFTMLIPPLKLWDVELITRYDFYLRAIVVLVSVVLFLKDFWKDRKIDIWVILFAVFSVLLIVSTFIHKGDLKQAIWGNAAVPAAVILLTGWSVRKNEKLTIRVLYLLYYIFGLINFYTVILNHNDDSAINYFFLNRNLHIFFYIIPLFCGLYGLEKGYLKSKLFYFLFYIICLCSALLAGGFITVTILLLWAFLLIPPCRALIDNNRLIVCFYLANLVLFILIHAHCLNGWTFFETILRIVHKEESFVEREKIWMTVWNEVRVYPILGHGIGNIEELTGYRHAHSIYLQILYNRGILGIGTLFSIIYLMHKKIRRMADGTLRAFMWILLVSMLLSGQVEVGYIQYYALYGSLIYYLNENKSNC